MEFSSKEVKRNALMLQDIKLALKLPENKNYTFVGLDFIVEYHSNGFKHKFKCMLCEKHLGKSGVLKHLQTEQHQTLFLNHCFPSFAAYLDKLACRQCDDTMKLIIDSFIKTLTIEICREIGRHYIPDQFCPLLATRMTEREFNSESMVFFILDKMPHVYEMDWLETKEAIDEAVKKFIAKSKQMLLIAEGNEKSPIKKNVKIQTNEKSPQKAQSCDKSPHKPIMTQTELDRMKVAINISMELVKNGLQISPSQLEDSVRSYYKFELKKSLPAEELDLFENLSSEDLTLLLENYESLCEDEQEHLKKYLTMLMKIEDKTYKELILNKKCAEIINEIIGI